MMFYMTCVVWDLSHETVTINQFFSVKYKPVNEWSQSLQYNTFLTHRNSEYLQLQFK